MFVFCILLSGCSGSKSPPEEETTAAKTSSPAETPNADASLSPEESVRRMVKGLQEHRPEVVWRAVPEGFQRDINGFVRDFARKMDPELWRQSFATWKSLARLLAEKKTEILNHPELANLPPENRQRLQENWDGLVELLTILVHSELGDLEQLESFDMGEFLEKTGGRWLSELAALSESLGQASLSGMLSGLEPKTISEDEDVAVMGWIAPGSPEPVSRFSLVKLDGRWVPAGWEAAWRHLGEQRAELRQTPAESFSAQSRDKLKALKKAEQTIQTLLTTKTSKEFQQTLDDELGQQTVSELAVLIGLLSGPTQETRVAEADSPQTQTVPKTSTDANTVTLFVKGAKGVEDEDRIFESLHNILPGDVEVQFPPTSDGLKVICGPVPDIEDFRKKIDFGTVTKVNANERTIHIEMKN